MTAPTWVRVVLSGPVEGPYTYAVAPEMAAGVPGGLRPGHALLVPLGTRSVTAWVVEVLDAPDVSEDRVRPVERVLDPEPVADEAQLAFLRWVARYYLASLGEMLSTAMPAATKARTRRVWLPGPVASGALEAGDLPEPRATVLREVVRHPGLTRDGILRRLSGEVTQLQVTTALRRMSLDGLVQGANREVGPGRDRVMRVRLAGPAPDPLPGARMRQVVARLAEAGGEMDLPDLLDLEGPAARASVTRLAGRGVVILEEVERNDPVETGDLEGAAKEPLPPTPAQAEALEALAQATRGTFLLYGVTGSGKTEVYLQAAARVIEAGRQVLVLVPEIGLTPQLVGRVRARFGDRVAVLHSGLTGRERLRGWRRVRRGEARVVVGARSALFAPFRDLGLVVVDEEHDDSYKQEDGVRYHARDMAVVRGTLAGCPVLLGTATPSTESLQNCSEGRYRLLKLADRVHGRPPPPVEVVDLWKEPRDADGRTPLLSTALTEALTEALSSGGQAIILHNRRGWATVVRCTGCDSRYTCPSCGISLVLHRRQNQLMCHYCGFKTPFRADCPICGSPLEALGEGDERLEDVLRTRFPWAPVARMDADTTAARGAHGRILEAFRRGDTRILVGTQVVAKGHDFPHVSLAAAVGIDHVLTLPDFRSAERTCALLTQLAGRAGRGVLPGRVLVQTFHPDHFVFRTIHDFETFHAREATQRRTLGYPPFTRLVLVRVESVEQRAAHAVARQIAEGLEAARPEGRLVDVLGPVPAPLARLMGRWRYQVVLRGWRLGPFRAWLEPRADWIREHARAGVRVVLDVDPRSLM
ncbi:MAG: primosomal protein N' [Deltaproteobacteria bacterium]|nr:primosomal protein N' [Deltaproteobacteria bacterium]